MTGAELTERTLAGLNALCALVLTAMWLTHRHRKET